MNRFVPSNTHDVLDAADLLRRLEELRDERSALQGEIDEAHEEDPPNTSDAVVERAQEALADWDMDNGDELNALEAIENEISDGDTLIRESHFEAYAREQASEAKGLDLHVWPLTCIDWKQAAEELQTDYHSVEFDGVTYWVQS